ncbi:MAG: NUDIX domain-containing protein, partial [Bacilli bacterium]|nr:NUDIX domain-containing protein [Bacilli bacterium]
MNNGLKRGICLCILENNDELLLIKRGKIKKDLEELGGFYIPIGGKIDPFETPNNAVIREVWEETGIKINNPQLLGILTETSPLPKYNNIVYFFYEKIEKQKLKKCEEGFFKWIKKSDINNIQTPEIDRIIYQYFEQKQNFIIDATYDDKLK